LVPSLRQINSTAEGQRYRDSQGCSGIHPQAAQSKQQSPEWQAAAEAVMMAAEDRGPLMHAHFGMMLALHGAKPIPEYDSSKERHWGKRKLKRDE